MLKISVVNEHEHTLFDPLKLNVDWLWNVNDREADGICCHGNWEVLDQVDEIKLRNDSI